MAYSPMQRVLLFGDHFGLTSLLRSTPVSSVAALIAASIRPQYHEAIASLASQHQLPLLIQPTLRDSQASRDFESQVASLQPDGLIACSYAQIIPSTLLSFVQGKAFNLHSALLPRHRGPNPVQWALIHGDEITGVTLHQMEETVDSGPIVAQRTLAITDEDTWHSLQQKLLHLTQIVIDECLPPLLEGQYTLTPQREKEAIINPRILPESLPIDWDKMTDRDVFNLIRAQCAPLKGAYVESQGMRIHFPALLSMQDIASIRARFSA